MYVITTSLNDITHLVVNPESDDLCQEGPREPGGDQEHVTVGTLVETLADHTSGKLVVAWSDTGWMVVVRVYLGYGRTHVGERQTIHVYSTY